MKPLKARVRVAQGGDSMFADGMWIFYLEALLVLAIGAFIVWWTMPKQRPAAQHEPGTSKDNAATDHAATDSAATDNAAKSLSILTTGSPANQTVPARDAARAAGDTQASTAPASGKD